MLLVQARWRTHPSSSLNVTKNLENKKTSKQRSTQNSEKEVDQLVALDQRNNSRRCLMTPYPTAGYVGPESPTHPRSPTVQPQVIQVGLHSSLSSNWGTASNTRWPHHIGRGNPATTSSRPSSAPYPRRLKSRFSHLQASAGLAWAAPFWSLPGASAGLTGSSRNTRQVRQSEIASQSLWKLNCHWNYSPQK